MEIVIFIVLVVLAICGGFAYIALMAKDVKTNKDHVFMDDVIEGKTDLSDAIPSSLIPDADDTDYAADPGDDSTDN